MGRQRKEEKYGTVAPEQASLSLLHPLVDDTVFISFSIAADLTTIHYNYSCTTIMFTVSPLSWPHGDAKHIHSTVFKWLTLQGKERPRSRQYNVFSATKPVT